VEDARASLRLYDVYKQLHAAGTLEDKLDELYAWGSTNGWDPVVLDASGSPIPPDTM
jgi:hypothetical protein